ncbi:MAG: GumC family protein [Sphingomonadales bacterium]
MDQRTPYTAVRDWGYDAAAASPGPSKSLDLLGFAASIWRRKSIVLSVAAILFVGFLIYLFQLVPRYEAVTTVRIGGPKANVVDIEAVLQSPGQSQSLVVTEIGVLNSRQLMGGVVDKLKLLEDPYFNPTLEPTDEKSVWRLINPFYYLGLVWEAVSPSDDAAGGGLTEEEQRARLRSNAVNMVLGMTEVRAQGLSSIIEIRVETPRPELSARIANAIADQYLVSQFEAKFNAAERASNWLNDRLGSLRTEVEAAERALEQFRAKSGIMSASGENSLLSQQASEMNAQMILAKTDAATAQARLSRIEQLYKSGGIEAVSKILDSDAIARLRAQESELQRQMAEQSQEFGERHPKMVALKAQIADTQVQIKTEVDKIMANLRNDAAVAQTRYGTLAGSLQSLQGQAGANSSEAAQLRMLEREAEAKRTLFDTFLKRFQETSASEDLQQADADIISRAEVPQKPSFPPMKEYLVIFALLSLGGGVGTAVFVDRILDRGFRRLDQLEEATGLHALSSIPIVKDGDLIRTVLEKPNSSFAEALRNLHTGIKLSSIDEEPKVVLMVSAVPGEGKTAVSTCLAAMLAKSGHRVLLVDSDLRRGRTHERLGLLPEPGLVNLLLDHKPISEIAQRHAPSGLDVVVGGGSVRSPQDLLGSKSMAEFLAQARKLYDYVIIDTPPSSIVSEARLMAAASDRVVMITHWNRTPRTLVAAAVRQLTEAGAQFSGAVLSQVGSRGAMIYGYDSYSPYYGKYGEYYQD